MNCFFIFLKLFQKYDIIKSLKGNKNEYFWSRSFTVLSVGGASKEKVPTFYPSSKTCSSCGNIKETLTLSERIYHCECCGLEIDRDYNASINILRKGLEILREEKVT